MNSKVAKLASTVRMAMRSYDNGKRDTAIKLIGLVAAQVGTADERKELHRLVESEVRGSGVWPHYQSILFGGGSSSAPKSSYPLLR